MDDLSQLSAMAAFAEWYGCRVIGSTGLEDCRVRCGRLADESPCDDFVNKEFDRSRLMKSGVKLDTLKDDMEGMLGRLIFESCRLSFMALNLLLLEKWKLTSAMHGT